MCRKMAFLCLAALLFVLQIARAESEITLTLVNADIKELISWAGKHTSRNIVLHPDVVGKVTVLARDPMNEAEAYRIFLSVLQLHRLVAVESDGILKVVPAEQAVHSDIRLLEGSGDDWQGSFDQEVVVRIIKTRNVKASTLVELLQPLASKEAVIAAYPDTNTLIVADNISNIDRLMKIISRIDSEDILNVETIDLNFVSALEVVKTVSKLIPNKNGLKKISVVADERANRVLISGDPEKSRQARALVISLDTPVTKDDKTQVVFVNFARAETLVPILKSIFEDELSEGGNKEGVKIIASEENNALVITGSRDAQRNIRNVIHKLDIRRSQVLVEAVVAEVNGNTMRDFGIDWQTNMSQDGIFSQGNTLGNFDTRIQQPGLVGGLTLGFFSSGELRGLLRALQADADSNILSMPTIVTMDNEEAEILVGSNVPFITGQSTGVASSTETPFQTITRKDIGIYLRVRPQINSDGSITLSVEQVVEDVDGATAAASDIVTSKREIRTKVLIDNNQALVLGGLIDDELNLTKKRIPIISKIPIVGRLFRSKGRKESKRNLMVFIRPQILKGKIDNDEITSSRYRSMLRLQERFDDEKKVLGRRHLDQSL